MFEWWNSLGITMQVFYCIAIPATLIIVIQTILLMIGIGHGGEGIEFSDTSGIDGLGDVPDMPADVPADIPTDMTAHAIEGCDHMTTGDGSNPADFGTMQLFTLQGIMTFLCVFGWTGIICTSLGLHVAIAIIIALVLGFLAMLGVAKVLQLTRRLTQDGSLDVRRLLGEKGDESGYIEALGKEAAAKAINDAKKSVAEKDRDGEIGQANAQRDQRIQVAAANALAIKGENESKIEVAQSEALRREKEAESMRLATAAEAVQAAKAKEEAYIAQQQAEQTRAALETATQQADVIVKAKIAKEQAEIEAEAKAEVARRTAKGEADALFAKMEAQARGAQEILVKQADGMRELVNAAGGNADSAIKLILANNMEELMKIQVEAIKNIKIDKVTVWDGGSKGENGKTATADFISGIMKAVPPMGEMFNQAGMELPKFLGEKIDDPKTLDS